MPSKISLLHMIPFQLWRAQPLWLWRAAAQGIEDVGCVACSEASKQAAATRLGVCAGPERCLCSVEGRLLFLPHIEAWVRGVRTKLMQWSMRLLKEEVWQHAAAGSMAGKQQFEKKTN